MKIIQRDALDDFEALSIANLMEKAGVQVFCITNEPSVITPEDKVNWKVWGRGTNEALERFFNLENNE